MKIEITNPDDPSILTWEDVKNAEGIYDVIDATKYESNLLIVLYTQQESRNRVYLYYLPSENRFFAIEEYGSFGIFPRKKYRKSNVRIVLSN